MYRCIFYFFHFFQFFFFFSFFSKKKSTRTLNIVASMSSAFNNLKLKNAKTLGAMRMLELVLATPGWCHLAFFVLLWLLLLLLLFFSLKKKDVKKPPGFYYFR